MSNITNPAAWDVVIIDDEPDNIGVVEYVLVFHNAMVRSAGSGACGLRLLSERRPTFVLLDIQMPGLSGWEVLKQIREDATLRDLPVFALTAYAMKGDRERVLEAGFDGYLSKPISPFTFVSDLSKMYESVAQKGGNCDNPSTVLNLTC